MFNWIRKLFTGADGDQDRTGLEDADASELMAICDEHWARLAQPAAEHAEDLVVGLDAYPESEGARRYNRYVSAANELTTRGPEILPWARERLAHPETDARELAAFLIGCLTERGRIPPDQLGGIIEELSTVALWPIDLDNDSAVASSAAIDALGKTNDRRAIPALRQVVTSPDWEDDENSDEAACALGRIVDEDFEAADEPVQAARAWLKRHET